MIAVILAGGKGTRLVKARPIPKPLINILDQPIINELVDKLLAFDTDTIEMIYVLTPKSYPNLNLEDLFTSWKEGQYPDEERVVVLFEDILPTSFSASASGAIVALERFAHWLSQNKHMTDRILAFAGDNLFQDSLVDFLAESKSWPCAIINAYYDFHDHNKIANKYGAVRLDNEWIVAYEEKPPNPQHDQTKASLAMYSFPYAEFTRVTEYVKDASYGVDAPGNLLRWFVDRHPAVPVDPPQRARGVRGYQLRGKWSDIGNPRDLQTAVIWFAAARVDRLETVSHLLVAEEVEKLDDKSFFMCRELELDPQTRTIKIFFRLDDPICKLDRSFGKAPEVKAVGASAANDEIWPLLHELLNDANQNLQNPIPRQVLKNPLLLSGGVCLFDTDTTRLVQDDREGAFNALPLDRTLIPLLERDALAPADPGRLTTAAGRMDMLDLEQVCYAELLEELIFYGTDDLRRQTRLYCCCPAGRNGKRRVLNRILQKRLEIPGLDRATVVGQAALQEEQIEIAEIVTPTEMILPRQYAWTVKIYLDDRLHHRCHQMCVIPDQPNGTLEFRRLAWVNLTHFDLASGSDKAARRVGRLLGIADGDGHGRRAFLPTTRALLDYYKQMNDRSQQQICDYIFSSQREAVRILSITDGITGRFSKLDAPMPLLSFTTSLSYLMRLLKAIIW